MPRTLALAAILTIGLTTVRAQDNGFKPLFNGKDLTGWHNVNGAPGTFFVKDNMIITTGKPTGYLRTDKHYENFIAEFDWMHVPPKKGEVGNSGFFVWCDPIPAVGTGYTRGIEVQVLVNLEWKDKKTGKSTATSQGDLFSIHGATCEPDRPHPLGWKRSIPKENHAKGEFEWNHYRVEANDGVIKLAVNGKFVSMVSKCNPRKGYLGLESEGSECRFKNLKIKELPSTNPKKEEICDLDKGFKNMYTGLDLSGWKTDENTKTHWQPRDTVLHCEGGTALKSAEGYGDGEFSADFRFPIKDAKPCTIIAREGNGDRMKLSISPAGHLKWGVVGSIEVEADVVFKPGQWNRFRASTKNQVLTMTVNDRELNSSSWAGLPNTGAFVLHPEGSMDFANLFVRGLK